MEEKLRIYSQFAEWQLCMDSWDLWDTTLDRCNEGYLPANNEDYVRSFLYRIE